MTKTNRIDLRLAESSKIPQHSHDDTPYIRKHTISAPADQNADSKTCFLKHFVPTLQVRATFRFHSAFKKKKVTHDRQRFAQEVGKKMCSLNMFKEALKTEIREKTQEEKGYEHI